MVYPVCPLELSGEPPTKKPRDGFPCGRINWILKAPELFPAAGVYRSNFLTVVPIVSCRMKIQAPATRPYATLLLRQLLHFQAVL